MKKRTPQARGRPPAEVKLSNRIPVMLADDDYEWVLQESAKENRKLGEWCRLVILAEKKRRESSDSDEKQ